MSCRKSIHYFVEINARNHIFPITEAHTVHPVSISVLRKLNFLHHEEILSPVLAMLCMVVLHAAGIVYSEQFRLSNAGSFVRVIKENYIAPMYGRQCMDNT